MSNKKIKNKIKKKALSNSTTNKPNNNKPRWSLRYHNLSKQQRYMEQQDFEEDDESLFYIEENGPGFAVMEEDVWETSVAPNNKADATLWALEATTTITTEDQEDEDDEDDEDEEDEELVHFSSFSQRGNVFNNVDLNWTDPRENQGEEEDDDDDDDDGDLGLVERLRQRRQRRQQLLRQVDGPKAALNSKNGGFLSFSIVDFKRHPTSFSFSTFSESSVSTLSDNPQETNKKNNANNNNPLLDQDKSLEGYEKEEEFDGDEEGEGERKDDGVKVSSNDKEKEVEVTNNEVSLMEKFRVLDETVAMEKKKKKNIASDDRLQQCSKSEDEPCLECPPPPDDHKTKPTTKTTKKKNLSFAEVVSHVSRCNGVPPPPPPPCAASTSNILGVSGDDDFGDNEKEEHDPTPYSMRRPRVDRTAKVVASLRDTYHGRRLSRRCMDW